MLNSYLLLMYRWSSSPSFCKYTGCHSSTNALTFSRSGSVSDHTWIWVLESGDVLHQVYDFSRFWEFKKWSGKRLSTQY